MVGRGAIVEHPAGGPLEGNFRQNNASLLVVTFRPPYKKLEGVLEVGHPSGTHFAGNLSQDNTPHILEILPNPLRNY